MSLAVTYRRPGDPAEVLEATDIGEPPPPGLGQLQVEITAFPIHPGDLLAISASSALAGEQIAGIEATGVVLDVGAGVSDFTPGSRVSYFPHSGAWCQVVNVDAAIAIPVPDSVPDEVAAQMLCNPITALLLRRAAQQHFGVGFDGVVLNNAAASSVGRLFTAIAERHQIATISIVRSKARPAATRPVPHGTSGFHRRPGLDRTGAHSRPRPTHTGRPGPRRRHRGGRPPVGALARRHPDHLRLTSP
jgi:NADPH:quinone reductase-like Zn-dependent oxidoreductase